GRHAGASPAERRVKHKEQHRHRGADRYEFMAVRMDWRQRLENRVEKALAVGHVFLLACVSDKQNHARYESGTATKRKSPLPSSTRNSTALRPDFFTFSMLLATSSGCETES